MQFFNVKLRKMVEVPDSEVKVVTMKNGKKAAQANFEGMKLFKIISNEDAIRLRV